MNVADFNIIHEWCDYLLGFSIGVSRVPARLVTLWCQTVMAERDCNLDYIKGDMSDLFISYVSAIY